LGGKRNLKESNLKKTSRHSQGQRSLKPFQQRKNQKRKN